MARPLRIEYPDTWYWTSNRCMQSRGLFPDARAYDQFLSLLPHLEERFQVEVHAFCLLPNEYHLLIHTRQANLADAMRYLQSLYSQRYNRHWRSEGPVFRGRYQSMILQPENYLLPVLTLLHQLPRLHQLATNPLDYVWSSHAEYWYGDSHLPWLHRSAIGNLLAMDGFNYRQYFVQSSPEELFKLVKAKRRAPILGDVHFKQDLLRNFRGDQKSVPDLQRLNEPPPLEQVLDSVASVLQVKRKALYEGRRGQLNVPRMMAIYLSHCRARMSLVQLADHFGMNHYSSASSAMQRYQRLRAREGRIQRLESDVLRHLEVNH